MNDAAVVVARLPEADRGQWVWTHDGLIWIVRGQLVSEQFVTALLAAQGAGSDPSDFQGLSGDLPDRLPTIPGVTYYQLDRPTALASMQNFISGPCAEAFAAFYIPAADDPDPEVADEHSFSILLSDIGRACADEGVLTDRLAELDANPQLRQETVAGRPVYRTDNEVIYVSSDLIADFSSLSPEIWLAMQPVIEQFIGAQPD